MRKQLYYTLLPALFVAASCKKESTAKIDTVYPVINISGSNAFPIQCSTVKRGEKFSFRAELNDNSALGSVSVDIHHNFDHHTHSTELTSCSMEAVKVPVKPFLLIQSYPIPSGLSRFEVIQEIAVPSDIDTGDYHFMIRLTDKEGWQTIKGLSIKII
jgi:hypothetical protein